MENLLIWKENGGYSTIDELRRCDAQTKNDLIEYIKEFSIYETLTVNGKKVSHAHNNWLQFAYTYGVPAMLLYLVITILSVIRSIRFYLTNRRRNATYAFLIPAICVGFVIATMTECLFLPFEIFPAFMYWFAFGDLFDDSLAEIVE